MRYIFFIIILLFVLDNSAQNDSIKYKHFVAMQFGGQTIVSFHHEYSLISTPNFLVNTNVGLGFNEYADDTDPDDRPIYGIHTGVLALIGKASWYLEFGFHPTTYFYRKVTFVNLNSWIGIRFLPKDYGLYVSTGYTPRLYTSYSDPRNNYFNSMIGVKLGFNF